MYIQIDKDKASPTYGKVIGTYRHPQQQEDGSFLTEPNEVPDRPSEVHTWNGTEWVLDTEKELAFEQAEQNKIARQYLSETDWYVVKFAETGVAIPDTIKKARQQSRDSIV